MSGIGIFSPSMIRPHRREVALLDVGQRHDRVHHGGRQPDGRHRERSSSSTTAAGVELAVDDRGRPRRDQRGRREVERADVVQRTAGEPEVGAGEAELDDVGEVLPGQVGVGDHHALGSPGRARRVHQAVDVVGRHGRAPAGRSPRQVGEGRPPVGGRGATQPHRRADARRSRRSASSRSASSHTRRGAGVLEDVPHLRRGQPPVDRHGDGAEVVGGEDRLQELGAVVREQRHDVAGPTPRSDRPPARGPRRSAISPYVVVSPSNTVIALSGVRVAWWASTANQLMSACIGAASRHSILYRPVSLEDGSAASVAADATSPPVSATQANWEARRQAIIDTSARVFARGGYHATGITELCTANELGKGALYHYIGSKEELLAAIHDRVMDEVMVGADRVAEGGSPSQQLDHARRRAARRDPPLPRSRLGLPARVPGAHRRAGRAVRERRQSTSDGSRRSSRPASTRASSVTSSPG